MILEADSLLLCEDKEELTKLCTLLNKAALDDSEEGLKGVGLKVLAIGRLEKSVVAKVNAGPEYDEEGQQGWPADNFFVWWDGKVGPQEEHWIWDYMVKHFEPGYCTCWPTYVEFISSVRPSGLRGRDMLVGMKDGRPGEDRENEWVKVFYPSEDGQIDLSLIEKL